MAQVATTVPLFPSLSQTTMPATLLLPPYSGLATNSTVTHPIGTLGWEYILWQMELNRLPEDVLIRIFNSSNVSTIATARKLNKRMHRIIEKHRLARPHVEEMSVELGLIEERKPGRFVIQKTKNERKRLVITMKKGAKSKQMTEETEGSNTENSKLLEEAMRTIRSTDKLCYEGITVDMDFYSILTRKWNDLSPVKTISLTHCKIELDEKQMSDLLRRMTIQSLTIDFCHRDSTVLCDQVFTCINGLRILRVQPRRILSYYPQFTDSTLEGWHVNPPTTILLYNCLTGISLQGIVDLIKVAISRNLSVDWDFGCFLPTVTTAESLMNLMMLCGLQTKTEDEFRVKRFTIQSNEAKFAFKMLCTLQ